MGTEARYKNKIKLLLKQQYPGVFAQAMASMYSNGTPDLYYEGLGSCLWVEYKFYDYQPKTLKLAENKLSPLQTQWLKRADNNKQRVAVIVGTPKGGIILPRLTWDGIHNTKDFGVMENTSVAKWIYEVVTEDDYVTWLNKDPRRSTGNYSWAIEHN